MIMKFILILSFSTSILFAQTKLTSIYKVKSYIGKSKQNTIIKNVRDIVYAGIPNRFFGTVGHKNVQSFIQNKLEKADELKNVSLQIDTFKIDTNAGIKSFEQDFNKKIKPVFKSDTKDFKKWSGFKDYMKKTIESKKEIDAKNFILTVKGASEETLIITAHYDTVIHNKETMIIDEKSKMPGADFNASSVAIMLELIDRVSTLELKKTLKFVFLDAQSLGFLGSYQFAKGLSEKDIGVINLEMLGYDSKTKDENKRLRNFKAYARDSRVDSKGVDKKLYELINKYVKKSGTSMNFKLDQNNFDHSDNVRFNKIANLTLSQNWEEDFNPNFQSKNDFPETLNQRTLYNSYKYIGIGILGYALDL